MIFIRNIKRFKRLSIIIKKFAYFKSSRSRRFLKLKELFKFKKSLFLISSIISANIDNISSVIFVNDNNFKKC